MQSSRLSHQGLSNYAAAKAGLYGLMKALAFEGKDHGITVNTILPGALSWSPVPRKRSPTCTRTRPPLSDRSTAGSSLAHGPRRCGAAHSRSCSPECDITGEAFSMAGGRCARVLRRDHGGMSPRRIPDSLTTENIADHLREIRDLTDYTVPWVGVFDMH